MKNTLISFFLIFFFFIYSAFSSETSLKLSGEFKFQGSENIEINETDLAKDKEIKKLKNDIEKLLAYIATESSKITKNNKNRKPRTKYKGAPEEIYSEYADSVVYIGNEKDNASGSGFFINHNGLKIITNWHVVESAKNVKLWLKPNPMVGEDFLLRNHDWYSGKVVKINKQKDLAMIEAKGIPKKIKGIMFEKYSKINVGETVFAIGHPGGLIWSFSDGRVSQVRPNYRWRYEGSMHTANVIQTTTAINPGNSGGPLFNKQKKLVGVNTFTATGESLNFAIAVDDLVKFINEAKQEDIDSKYITKKSDCPTSVYIKKKSEKKCKNKKNGIMKKYPNAQLYDANDNGITDFWFVDTNKNGVVDKAYADFNEDGIIDSVGIDENENENFEIIIFDDDSDGIFDRAEIDEDDDGTADIMAYDFNNDGEWDKYENLG